MIFGRLINAERKRKRMTLRMLGDACDLSIAYLHDVEHGRRKAPSRSACTVILDALGVRGEKRKQMLNQAEVEVMHAAARKWRGEVGTESEGTEP